VQRRGLILLSILLSAIAVVAALAVRVGLDETRLALSGPQRNLEASEVAGRRGWVAVWGCMRHDWAVGVRQSGEVYRLGEAEVKRRERGAAWQTLFGPSDPEKDKVSVEADRVYTPLAARDDCDEDKPPKQVHLLVENDESLGDTLRKAWAGQVRPPPVPAFVGGVIGYNTGDRARADKARSRLVSLGLAAGDAPLLAKGRRPGALWIGAVTLSLGAHGLFFCAFTAFWLVRRERRRRAILRGDTSEAEEAFFDAPPSDDA
jgi:hypothetical protein